MIVGPGSETSTRQQAPPIQALYAPVKIDSQEIRTLFHAWIKNLWFAPAEFVSKLTLGPVYSKFVYCD